MRASPGRVKRFVFAAIMVSFTAATCYLIIERGFAAYYYSNTAEIADKKFDPVLGWRIKTETFWVKPPDSFRKVRIDINEFGLRHGPLAPMSRKQPRRMIVLGDSFTFAKVIHTEDLFTTRLENLLREQGEEYEVINAGVPGYGNSQELLLMRSLADEGVVADIYLLVLFTNDILDNLRLSYGDLKDQSVRPGFVLNRSGKPELAHPPLRIQTDTSDTLVPVQTSPPKTKALQVIKSWIESALQSRPALLRFLMRLGIDIEFPRMPGVLNGWYREEILADGVPLMKALIGEIRDEAERRKARLMVAIIPSPIQVYPDAYGPLLERTFPDNELVDTWLADRTRPQTMMSGMCRDLGIPFLDLLPVLSADDDGALFIPREGHFTKRAHLLVAHQLADFVLENLDSADPAASARDRTATADGR